jgi:excisionase family DNA binding protein
MVRKQYITISQLAKMLGISRIAVYKKVKKGQIPAEKIGGVYVISDSHINRILRKQVTPTDKKQIDRAVKKAVSEYGELLKMLARQ